MNKREAIENFKKHWTHMLKHNPSDKKCYQQALLWHSGCSLCQFVWESNGGRIDCTICPGWKKWPLYDSTGFVDKCTISVSIYIKWSGSLMGSEIEKECVKRMIGFADQLLEELDKEEGR